MMGIPATKWADALADSGMLSFEEWCAVYVPMRPHNIRPSAWLRQARGIYESGPLVYFQAMHVN